MEVKKYDKIILDSTRSIDDIVASIKAELSKQESQNAGESYICYVSHAYSSGQNAGVSYIVVSDDFKRLNRLSSNVIQANAYTKEEINELIARVDAKIPVDEAKLAKQNELKRVEADILGKEQSIPRKRQELLTLNEQKRVLEANLATITELINEKEQAGENTEILQAQKRQYESDIATKSSQITNLESEINQLNSDIEVLNQTKERLKREEALIQSPELATKEYVDNLKANLDSKSSELNSRIDSVNSDLTNIIDTKANADAVVNLTGEQTIEGVKTFTSNITAPNLTTMQNSINTLNNKFTTLEQPIINLTLGDISSGAQFQTLDAALAEAVKHFGNKSVTITLLSDITINKSHDISPANSMISFVSNDNNKHTINFDTGAQLNFWGRRFWFNKINFKTTQSNITISRALNTAVGVFEKCSFDGAATAIVCRNSFLGIIACEFTNISVTCLNNYRNGIVNFAYSTINANVAQLVSQNQGGVVSVDHTTINTPFTNAKYNIAANTLTKNGIIFDND